MAPSIMFVLVSLQLCYFITAMPNQLQTGRYMPRDGNIFNEDVIGKQEPVLTSQTNPRYMTGVVQQGNLGRNNGISQTQTGVPNRGIQRGTRPVPVTPSYYMNVPNRTPPQTVATSAGPNMSAQPTETQKTASFGSGVLPQYLLTPTKVTTQPSLWYNIPPGISGPYNNYLPQTQTANGRRNPYIPTFNNEEQPEKETITTGRRTIKKPKRKSKVSNKRKPKNYNGYQRPDLMTSAVPEEISSEFNSETETTALNKDHETETQTALLANGPVANIIPSSIEVHEPKSSKTLSTSNVAEGLENIQPQIKQSGLVQMENNSNSDSEIKERRVVYDKPVETLNTNEFSGIEHHIPTNETEVEDHTSTKIEADLNASKVNSESTEVTTDLAEPSENIHPKVMPSEIEPGTSLSDSDTNIRTSSLHTDQQTQTPLANLARESILPTVLPPDERETPTISKTLSTSNVHNVPRNTESGVADGLKNIQPEMIDPDIRPVSYNSNSHEIKTRGLGSNPTIETLTAGIVSGPDQLTPSYRFQDDTSTAPGILAATGESKVNSDLKEITNGVIGALENELPEMTESVIVLAPNTSNSDGGINVRDAGNNQSIETLTADVVNGTDPSSSVVVENRAAPENEAASDVPKVNSELTERMNDVVGGLEKVHIEVIPSEKVPENRRLIDSAIDILPIIQDTLDTVAGENTPNSISITDRTMGNNEATIPNNTDYELTDHSSSTSTDIEQMLLPTNLVTSPKIISEQVNMHTGSIAVNLIRGQKITEMSSPDSDTNKEEVPMVSDPVSKINPLDDTSSSIQYIPPSKLDIDEKSVSTEKVANNDFGSSTLHQPESKAEKRKAILAEGLDLTNFTPDHVYGEIARTSEHINGDGNLSTLSSTKIEENSSSPATVPCCDGDSTSQDVSKIGYSNIDQLFSTPQSISHFPTANLERETADSSTTSIVTSSSPDNMLEEQTLIQ